MDHKFLSPVSKKCEVVVFAPNTGSFHITPYLKMPTNSAILATGTSIEELREENADFRKVILCSIESLFSLGRCYITILLVFFLRPMF